MTLPELYKNLKSGYTHENLHAITTKVIDLYKNKQYDSIDQIMSVISEYTKEAKERQNKAFYTLMMIYHPDRIKHYLAEIERHFAAKDRTELLKYAHIFPVLELERTLTVEKRDLFEFREPEEYGWDDKADEYDDLDDEHEQEFENEEGSLDESDGQVNGWSFFNAFKHSVYGTRNIDLPYYYLEELEVLDMSGYEINDLDGVGHCLLMISLDLSNNAIDDIADLSSLSHLREIYLSGNQIGYIDSLGYCAELRIVDISNNTIDDISPLFDLEHLEYVNLIGNPVPVQQIDQLRSMNVMVIF